MTNRLMIADIRAAGYCVSGALKHADRLGLDRRLLVREGLPFEQVEDIDDHNLQRSLDFARKRIERGG